jgi:DNA-binding Xre family transcriptional regulator
MTKKKALSTFDQEMRNPKFKASFEKGYKEFLLSELLIDLMEESHKSVRKLADEVGISPTIIQRVRSGKQSDLKMKNFLSIAEACGYHLVLEKGKNRIAI